MRSDALNLYAFGRGVVGLQMNLKMNLKYLEQANDIFREKCTSPRINCSKTAFMQFESAMGF